MFSNATVHCISTRSDCEHFGVDVPEFPVAEELVADISRYEKMWSLYDQFHTGLAELTKEDWISFRYCCTVCSIRVVVFFPPCVIKCYTFLNICAIYSRYFGWGKLKDSLSTKCSEHLKIASIKLDCLNLLKLSFAKCNLTCQHSPLSNFPLIWLMRHSIVQMSHFLYVLPVCGWCIVQWQY